MVKSLRNRSVGVGDSSLREVTSVISLVYAPARICMPPMETNLSYKVFVSSEVMEAVNDTQVNVYRDVFEQLVKPPLRRSSRM